MKHKKEKQTDIVFGIKQWAFFEQQLHAMRSVGALVHRWTFALFPPHQKHLITSLLQGQTRLVDPLVRDQIINNRYDGTIHAGKNRKIRNAE